MTTTAQRVAELTGPGERVAIVLPNSVVSFRTRPPARFVSENDSVKTRVTLISRSGCHLCEQAEAALDRIVPDGWARVDVESSIELERDYGDRVPVVLLDGAEHGYWRVEEARLLRDLERQPGESRL